MNTNIFYYYISIYFLWQLTKNAAFYVKACPIYLTIGLDGKIYQESALQLNWASDCYVRPEWYGIYLEEPSGILQQPYVRITNVSDAIFKLPIKQKVGKLKFPKGWNRNDPIAVRGERYKKMKCLDYYVASFRQTELLGVECMKIYPTWMTTYEDIAQMQLKDLFIPGTHASGAYLANYGATKSIFIKEHAISQYFDVWSQLVFGIRYLDLSIGYKAVDIYDTENPENFWVANENMFINQLRFILKDIRKFVSLSGEVVILDFSSFPIGFYKHPERHTELFTMINRELGELAYVHNDTNTPCFNLTIEQITRTNRTIIILYPLDELQHPANESPILCSPWKRFSTGFMNTSQALDYMRLLFSKKNSSPVHDEGWIFNAIKSMEQSLNTNRLQTAKERASHINAKVSNWLRGPWGSTANVVTMDYFSSTNIIDVAINANLQKAFLKSNKNYVHFEISAFTRTLYGHRSLPTKFCKDENIQHLLIATDVPRGNGQVKRMHKIIVSMLSKLCAEESINWYRHLRKVQMVMNSTPSRNTQFSPFKLLTGVEMRVSGQPDLREILNDEAQEIFFRDRDEVRAEARENILKIQNENMKTSNRKR